MHLNTFQQTTLLQSQLFIETDSHNTLHLKLSSKKAIPQQLFLKKIQEIQQKQLKDSSKAIWVHLNQFNLSFIQPLLQKDYFIHRGYKKDVSLYKWTADHKDSIPQFSRVFVGCGAMIVKDQHVFLVQEKSGERKGFYGLPGGRADPGEFISQATQRQLFQQTGIKSTFQYILYLRQLPKGLWGSYDIYFASVVTVDEKQFQNIKLCENEISCYKWVHLSEYEKFVAGNGFGTQMHIGRYVTELYNKGYDFGKKSNLAMETLYNPNSDVTMLQHLLTGVELLKKKE